MTHPTKPRFAAPLALLPVLLALLGGVARATDPIMGAKNGGAGTSVTKADRAEPADHRPVPDPDFDPDSRSNSEPDPDSEPEPDSNPGRGPGPDPGPNPGADPGNGVGAIAAPVGRISWREVSNWRELHDAANK
ncbi:MAG: hypothetical protein V4754_12575 [Pseudomonadota bacterium]